MSFDLLLHTCCGPCLEAPARDLLKRGVSFYAWFHNPNIHPDAEHQRRREGFEQVLTILKLAGSAESESITQPWQIPFANRMDRCRMCYERRLMAAARKAAELGIPTFTSTLLVSPWQDRDQIIAAGLAAGDAVGVAFAIEDWRMLYRAGQEQAKADGIYRQKYCGCIKSLEESPLRKKIEQSLAAASAEPVSSDNLHK